MLNIKKHASFCLFTGALIGTSLAQANCESFGNNLAKVCDAVDENGDAYVLIDGGSADSEVNVTLVYNFRTLQQFAKVEIINKKDTDERYSWESQVVSFSHDLSQKAEDAYQRMPFPGGWLYLTNIEVDNLMNQWSHYQVKAHMGRGDDKVTFTKKGVYISSLSSSVPRHEYDKGFRGNFRSYAEAYGGKGDDEINGFSIAYGGDGDDTIYGSNNNDTLMGEEGRDYINGLGGTDICNGGKAKDEKLNCEKKY